MVRELFEFIFRYRVDLMLIGLIVVIFLLLRYLLSNTQEITDHKEE